MARIKFGEFLLPLLAGGEPQKQQLQFIETRRPVPAAKCGHDTFGRPYLTSIPPTQRKPSRDRRIPVVSAIIRTVAGIRRLGEYDETRMS